eukprot:3528112-Prymnesium_polylepis.1
MKAKLLPPCRGPLPPPIALPTAVVDGYSNATRERDRYMIQWYAFRCKNCGCVWRKDTVTVSFRQTAVSECFKSKKTCSLRAEYARMQKEWRVVDHGSPHARQRWDGSDSVCRRNSGSKGAWSDCCRRSNQQSARILHSFGEAWRQSACLLRLGQPEFRIRFRKDE